jgi:hypothetical protein
MRTPARVANWLLEETMPAAAIVGGRPTAYLKSTVTALL